MLKGIIGFAIGFLFVWLLVLVPMFGLHINTGSGSHVGYITATEKGGLIWKTGTAFIKTDAQSSQEDAYCVMDENVMTQLKSLAETRAKVEVNYMSYLSAGFTNCNAEGAIITSVRELK